MNYFRETVIKGNQREVNRVREIFGNIYLGNMIEDVEFTVMRVFPNDYRRWKDNELRGADVVVLVPDKDIECIWVDKLEGVESVKLAQAWDGKQAITSAIAVVKENVVLYLCLSPQGARIDETTKSFGL